MRKIKRISYIATSFQNAGEYLCVGEHLLITFSAFVLCALIFGIICEIAKRRNESEYVWLRNICVDGRKKTRTTWLLYQQLLLLLTTIKTKTRISHEKKERKMPTLFLLRSYESVFCAFEMFRKRWKMLHCISCDKNSSVAPLPTSQSENGKNVTWNDE